MRHFPTLLIALFFPAGMPGADLAANDWVSAVLRARPGQALASSWKSLQTEFPSECDWAFQDAGEAFPDWLSGARTEVIELAMLEKALAELGPSAPALHTRLNQLRSSLSTPSAATARLELYLQACEQRRSLRLRHLQETAPRIVFTKRRTVRPSFFAYTEGQSDAQAERHFLPGSELCLLELQGSRGKVTPLLSDPAGAIRDPAVSWEGDRILFAWKKSLNEDDYHLYELTAGSGQIRQITFGLGFADYEPAYLPNGDIVFASTRCVQTVDCFWTEASNLYTCDRNGRHLRRLTFDQVHAIFPQVLDDGRVIYTRWDYNDRGQVFPQPLFQMNPDGTAQTEFYGNNSWFPTTIAHARGIPGTGKVLAILCGHHSSQAGKAAIIDPSLGRQENSGVRLVAPLRIPAAERIDAYGQTGELWQYPFPLTEHEFLCAFAPAGWEAADRRRGDAAFGIYWMDVDGRRELLASDPALPCTQPVPLRSRPKPPVRPSLVDHSQPGGAFYLQDIYAGPGLAGIPRGAVKKLRVVALDFRAAGIGQNFSSGPGGGALISTPISVGNGAWDVKTVLGEVDVGPGGSASFTVPAQTPVYFQAIDERGYVIQTMRSWATLQPGEVQSCVGCHEHKNSAPPVPAYGPGAPAAPPPQELQPFHGPARGFSFPKEIQPILDRHCTRCHHDRTAVERLASPDAKEPVLANRAKPVDGKPVSSEHQTAFSLLASDGIPDPVSKRKWSDAYLTLTSATRHRGAFQGNFRASLVNWIGSQSPPEMLPPYSAGAAQSDLLRLLSENHGGVSLTREEIGKIACWIDLLVPYCGDYLEAHAWTDEEMQKYQRFTGKRLRMQAEEEINRKALAGVKSSSQPLEN